MSSSRSSSSSVRNPYDSSSNMYIPAKNNSSNFDYEFVGVKCKCDLPTPCQETWKEGTLDPGRRFFGCSRFWEFSVSVGLAILVKPQPNIVKVSVDAAIFESREEICFAVIARGSYGLLIEAKALVQHEVVAPVLAEAIAVKEALSWIDSMQWSRVTLESDCQVVVEAIRATTPMRSRFGVIVSECRKIILV